MTTKNNSLFGEPIYSYSRAQAISDGVLIDLTQFPIVKQHWKLNLCCTDTVWNIIDGATKNHGKDLNGILHDVSMGAKLEIAHQNGSILQFKCTIGPVCHHLKMICGPGDNPLPVLTLLMSTED